MVGRQEHTWESVITRGYRAILNDAFINCVSFGNGRDTGEGRMAKDPKCVNVKCLNSWGTHLNCLLNLKQIGQKKWKVFN